MLRTTMGLLVGAALLAPAAAFAQSTDNSAAVEALFTEGKRLEGEGRFAQACPKFLASYNLEHRVGTLLNLADCYEKNAQLASAWARFVEARTLAVRGNQPERAQYAGDHAAALAPKLSKLVIAVTNPAPGLAVKIDGQPVDAAAFGVAVPMDAGKHTLEATAPDRVTFTGEVTVGGDAEQKTTTVPELAAAPKVAPLPETPRVEESHGLGGRRIAALAIAGAGVVSLGVGAFFGATALGKNSDSSPYCNQGGVKNNCYGAGISDRNDAVSDATLSTVFLGAGAAVVIGGAVLFLTAPSSSTPSATVGFDGRMMRLTGSF
jgi:hypothetical protein